MFASQESSRGWKFACLQSVSQLRRSSSGQRSSATTMKTIMAEEMSKDVGTKHAHSNVVAKLMGLEALSQKKPHSCDEKSLSRSSPCIRYAPLERVARSWNKERPFLDEEVPNESHERLQLQQSDYLRGTGEQPLQRERRGRSKHEKKMALVREKFMEAKRLVTDEKLRNSKEFRDALELLASNRELFLSYLQETNSLFSGNVTELQSLPRETKHITLLRPLKIVDHEKSYMTGSQNDKLMKQLPSVADPTRLDVSVGDAKCVYDCDKEDSHDCPPHLTQIVLLKPSSEKKFETKASSSSCLQDANCYEKIEPRDAMVDITRKVLENLVSGRRDGALLSSVYSNSYADDGCSFYKAEGNATGNLSDSEVMSPPYRHSWDFINKVGSPCSFSSFSRASYSPESSVSREAKRRLSERWALMASHQTSHEQRDVRKDSSTLGEMLALFDDTNKKFARPEGSALGEERQQIGYPFRPASDSNKGESLVDSPKLLRRSKSMPVNSSAYSDSLFVEEVDQRMSKSNAPKVSAEKGDVKPSSFKGKVSSLFSFMSRKSKKEKPRHEDEIQSSMVDSLGDLMEAKNRDHTSEVGDGKCYGECSSPSQIKSLTEDADGHRSGDTVANEAELTVSKPEVSDSKQNQDHPSPISVLNPSFDEDDSLASESSGEQGPVLPHRFNLIDKSPPIGSIARTLSWDDTAVNQAAAPYFSKVHNVSTMEEELDWLAFVQTLLSKAGFDSHLSLDTFISRCYSQESPLNPSLWEKFTGVNDQEMVMPEMKRRQERSKRKLAYDCVNTALVNVTGGCGPNGPHDETLDGAGLATLSPIRDRVWAQVKEWLSDEVRCVPKDDKDSSSCISLGVEKVVRNEVVGKSWVDHLAIEMDCLGKDIELKLVNELVDEAVTDLSS